MSNRIPQPSKNKQILGVLGGMSLGGCFCLIILFGVNFQNGTGFENRTLWDWMDLFLLPLILLASLPGLYWLFKRAQEQRANLEQEITQDNQQEALMNSYIDLITTLFLEERLESEGDQDE